MRYVHVKVDDGEVEVFDQIQEDKAGYGWIFEVPDNFRLTILLKDMPGMCYIYEALLDRRTAPDIKLVWQET